MAYRHGVYTSEVPTSIIPAVNTNAGLPVIFGTAPLHLATDPAEANKPILCYSYKEAVEQLGYSGDWDKYTLCEAIYSQFALYNRAPVVFVNVLDPKKHKKAVENKEVQLTKKTGSVKAAVVLSTLVVKSTSGGSALTKGTDYEAAYNDDEELVITVLDGGSAVAAKSVFLTYDELDPTAVDAEDIIGGVDVNTGEYKGLETLNSVFPRFNLVPGLVLAPGWSQNPSIAAIMVAKAGNINSHFKAMVLTDVPTDTVRKYSAVSEWKNQNNYSDPNEVICWPMVRNGDTLFHMSTHLLGVMAQTDSDNGDIPYVSPSNKTMQITGTCLADGTEVVLGPDEAAYLNGQGIVTALNFIGGWKAWGNRTACYPANTDAKDAFIPVRRMFNWHAQTFILTYWAKVDGPINKRLIQTIIDSENIRLNGYVAQGVLLGGRVEFIESENPTTNLLDGVIKFHTYLTPPTPARVIENVIEYDPSYFATLFN